MPFTEDAHYGTIARIAVAGSHHICDIHAFLEEAKRFAKLRRD